MLEYIVKQSSVDGNYLNRFYHMLVDLYDKLNANDGDAIWQTLC